MIKFGASSRFFNLISTLDEDREKELPQNNIETPEQISCNNDGCSWGMESTDCSDEVEDTGDIVALKSIISAMKSDKNALSSPNEHIFKENPLKSLQTWFEQEGCDFDYKVNTVANNKFVCVLELPVDGQWITVDGTPQIRVSILHEVIFYL